MYGIAYVIALGSHKQRCRGLDISNAVSAFTMHTLKKFQRREFFPLDGWESDEDDDDDGEWVDIYRSSDEEEEVQFVYFRFVGLNVCF